MATGFQKSVALPAHQPLKPGGRLENLVGNCHRATGSFEPCPTLHTCMPDKEFWVKCLDFIVMIKSI